MKISDSIEKGEAGVAAVEVIFRERLKWIFRRQYPSDYGIDAHAEIVIDESPTGTLIALQVKTGKSWFKREKDMSWVFRPKNEHVEYWLGHNLPVFVVLYNPEIEKAYWQVVNEQTIKRHEKGSTLLIPQKNILSGNSRTRIIREASGPPRIQRLRQLEFDRKLIAATGQYNVLHLEIDEWVNKLSGRADFTLFVEQDNGGQLVLASWIGLGFSGDMYDFEQLFPWANLSRNELFDENDFEDDPDMQDYRDDIAGELSDLHPYTMLGAGEVAKWRLLVELNELGRAFLLVDRYLETE